MGCPTRVELALQVPQTCAFPRRPRAPRVDQAGLEPARGGVWNRCSATELLIGAPRRIRTSVTGSVATVSYPLNDERKKTAAGHSFPAIFVGAAGIEPAASTVSR